MLEDLISRLEKAEAGSPALDREINRVLSPDHTKPWMGPGYWYDDSTQPGQNERYRPYTTSIDAALTLVPDEWTAWEVASRGGKRKFRAEVSRLRDPSDYGSEEGEYGHASTPALAICIAALKARNA